MKITLALFCFILLAIVIGPFLIIWSLNTLFPALLISYNPTTWLAVVIIGAFFNASLDSKN